MDDNAYQEHHRHMTEALRLARGAARGGNQPFGALLVINGNVVLEAINTVHTDQDITCHAEMNLVRDAVHEFDPAVLDRAILYTSTEPCVMCAGAIYWANIGTVVFGCSHEALAERAHPTLHISGTEVFERAVREVTVIGPFLEEEAIKIHEEYWNK
jgi:tRNA(Arg) A34 adenosine deaminase TadA